MRRPAPAPVHTAVCVAALGCVGALSLSALPAAADVLGPVTSATSLSWSGGTGTSYADGQANGGTARLTWSFGTGRGTVTAAAPSSALVVRARGDQCGGAPNLSVVVDGRTVGRQSVGATGWTDYRFPGDFAAGGRTVALTFDNDYVGPGCDRNLRLDTVAFSAGTAAAPAPAPAPPPPTSGNPLAGATFYADPQSNAARTAASLRGSDPAGATLFDKIASQGAAEWIGDWYPADQVTDVVAGKVSAAGSAVPTLVLYATPLRDCGSYSAGGLPDTAAYGRWVRAVAAGIGDRRTVVVVEPDALGHVDCLTAAQRDARYAMLRDAVEVLRAQPGALVYLDAGNSTWEPVAEMASRLRAAGVARARGFALNVANFNPTGNEITYGNALVASLGGGGFVIDTSRNGRGPASTWCNPSGQGLGARPTSATGAANADAFLWVKRVGESDGTCNGGPPAGTWWPEYARGLAERAAW